MKQFCKYIGLILIVIGASILVVSFFMRSMSNNIVLVVSLSLIVLGLIAYIFLNKYIR